MMDAMMDGGIDLCHARMDGLLVVTVRSSSIIHVLYKSIERIVTEFRPFAEYST
jgi:hypothetical protein